MEDGGPKPAGLRAWPSSMLDSRSSLVGVLSLILMLIAAAGCNVAGVAAAKIVGPPDVPAKYVPQKEPMLVLVESYRRPGLDHDAEQLARFTVEQIKHWNIAPTIDLMDLYALRDSRGGAEFAKMSIAEVGRALGAKQVLYVEVTDASVDPSGGTEVYRGQMAVRVRIVDSATGQTRWPTDAESGYPVAYEPRFSGFGDNANPNTVRQQTYSGTAYEIVRNFRKWKPDNLQEEDMQQAGMGG